MNPTKIEWTDYTINPIKGKCRTGCSYCYATRMYDRFKWNPQVRLCLEEFNKLKSLKKPSKIFLCSTHEMFGKWIPDDWIHNILHYVRMIYPQHTFQILTKNPERATKYNFPKNVWVGMTITKEDELYHQEVLDAIKASVRFVSYEPLLESLFGMAYNIVYPDIDWVIIGAETGSRKNRVNPERRWIEQIITDAKKHNIPVFLKDNLKPFWDGEWYREYPNGGMTG